MNVKNHLLVLGVGNPLMGDDGIGVIIARRLRNWGISGVKIVEAGTAGFGLIDLVRRKSRVVFIDAVDGGRPPGSVFWVDPEAIIRDWKRQSLHQAGLADVLSLLTIGGDDPWVRIIGIQPERVGVATDVSDVLRRRLPIITQKTVDMINSVK